MRSQANAALIGELKARAERLGFTAFGITNADARPDLPAKLAAALEAGWTGDMAWMGATAARRASPKVLWPEVRSIIMLGLNYGPETDPMAALAARNTGNISVYARHRDYHDLIKGRLKELAGILARRTGEDVKVFVDTAPVMEKPLAQAAGLGWQGKHSVLVSREAGSWLFLGAIFTSAQLPASTPHEENCGTCQKCLDVCPTHAFPAPFKLDARRCLAYLTVEHKGPIPREFRVPMGNRIYGCDDCLAVCPWNKFASATREAKLHARADLDASQLVDLVALDDKRFRSLFSGSPVKRVGHARFLRNVLVALGNSSVEGGGAIAARRLADPEPLVRGAAVWAARRLLPTAEAGALARSALPLEKDATVREEWTAPVPRNGQDDAIP